MYFLLSNKSLFLRPVTDADLPVLLDIYGSTREKELELVSFWSANQKRDFIAQQFNAQHTYYHALYPDIDYWIIESKGETIGRLYLDKTTRGNNVSITDITLLPSVRNKGLGSQIIIDIINYAYAIDKPVVIQVESFNPALNLYKRLGFEIVSDTTQMYYLLEHKAKEKIEIESFA